MSIPRPRALLLCVAGLIATLVLSACGRGSAPDNSSPAADPSAASPRTAQARPPIFIDPANAQGKTYQVALGSAAVLQVPDGEQAQWDATVQDSGIVRFDPGGTRGSATFNPGFVPLAAGTTQVTISNGRTGASSTFTIIVTPGRGDG